MNKTILAVALTGLMFAAPAAQAVQMHLDSYEQPFVGATADGSYHADGVIGYFSITPGSAVGTPLEGLDKLVALCIEPLQNVSPNSTNIFDVVNLENAPSSDLTDSNVGMGFSNALLLADFAWEIGFVMDDAGVLMTAIDDMTATEKQALAILQWEASDDTMDLAAGDTTFNNTTTGYAMAAQFIADFNDGLTTLPDGVSVASLGLINRGANGTSNNGQDFSVYLVDDNREITVPEPASLALLGLGLIGLGFTKRNARKS